MILPLGSVTLVAYGFESRRQHHRAVPFIRDGLLIIFQKLKERVGLMRPLTLGDRCYKFYPSETPLISGPGSIVYQAHKRYTGNKLFFFRKDEAVSSLKNLLYFMTYGDMLAEIIVDRDLINCAQEASPHHFASEAFIVGNVYNANSAELLHLMMEALNCCNDFTILGVKDILVSVIEKGGFDTAAAIYDALVTRSANFFATEDLQYIKELSTRYWRNTISLRETQECTHFKDFLLLLKTSIGSTNVI